VSRALGIVLAARKANGTTAPQALQRGAEVLGSHGVVITRRSSMRVGPARRAPYPLFQDEDIDIDDPRSGPRDGIEEDEDDEDDVTPLDDDDLPSDEDELEGEEAIGSR